MGDAAYKIVGTKATVAFAKEERVEEHTFKNRRLFEEVSAFVKSANCHRKATD